MPKPRVVIFNDTHGWHSEQLTASFNALGIDTVYSDLALCRIDLTLPNRISIPGLDNQLPDAVLVRGIAPGSLEQITLRMDVLHTLHEIGIPVLNSASVIELTVDKARTSLRLAMAGLNTPPTWACEDRQQAVDIIRRELNAGYSVVMKPLFGCQGKGIIRIDSLEQMDLVVPVGEAFYLQRYVLPEQQGAWQDWRLMVIENQLVAAMSRRSGHWITNFAQGAQCFATTVTEEMHDLALAATRAVEAPYAGVDLIKDHNGRFSVLEVNSVPAWKGLHQATGIDIAGPITKMVANHISQKQPNKFPENVI